MSSYLPPELINDIAVHLSRQDLTNAVIINKIWFAVCTPYLWTTFRIYKNNVPAFSSPQFRQAFAQNHHYIRNLQYKGTAPLIAQLTINHHPYLETSQTAR